MRTLKHEEVDDHTYRDLADAQAGIETFIEAVYNRQRLRSDLDYRSPPVFENENRSSPWPPPAAAMETITKVMCLIQGLRFLGFRGAGHRPLCV